MEEQVVQQPQPGAKKWILVAALVLLVLAGAVWLLFGANRFYLDIALAGDEIVTLEYGEEYVDAGAAVTLRGTMLFQGGIDVEGIQLTTEDGVDAGALGEYTVEYSASYYRLAAAAQRTVRIVDTTPPVIQLMDYGVPTPAGKPYEEEGYKAQDNHDGDLTEQVERTELYGMVRYTVTDSSGNTATAEREVPIFDGIPPTILLEGEKNMTLQLGRPFEEPGYLALDNMDGELTEQVIIEGEVDCFTPGIYPLTYKVKDAYGNWGMEIRAVEVPKFTKPQVVTPKGKVIYLTFDDGPGPYTDELLYLLNIYGIKATFFVTDSGYNHLLRQIVEDGHAIGIHTVNHDYNTIYSSPENFFVDLYTMQDIIHRETGVKTTLMRFPGGSSNLVSRPLSRGIMSKLTRAVQDAGFQYFDWNVDSNDAGGAISREVIAGNVIGGVMNERISIVLQHDIHGNSVNAVEDIILWGLENGYTFLPLQSDSPGCHHPVLN